VIVYIHIRFTELYILSRDVLIQELKDSKLDKYLFLIIESVIESINASDTYRFGLCEEFSSVLPNLEELKSKRANGFERLTEDDWKDLDERWEKVKMVCSFFFELASANREVKSLDAKGSV
jgi:hypothetical protein